MLEIKLSLDWKDYARLVRGESLVHQDNEVPITIKIELKDIGFDLMHAIVERAKTAQNDSENTPN